MADVKVPAKLHLMSKAAQKAWYKKNKMEMPKEKSVAQSGKIKPVEKKAAAPVKPKSAREISMERQKAYYAKGGRAPIGAGGSGGSSAMAGVGQSTAKEIIKGIKAGINPKVALVRYTNEEVKKVDEMDYKPKQKPESNYPGARLQRDNMRRFKHYESPQEREDRLSKLATGYKAGRWAFGGKYEQVEVEQMEEVTKKEAEAALGGPVKAKPKMPPGKQPAGYRYVRGLARKAMKAGMKKEEVEQTDEAAKDWQKAFSGVAQKNLQKDIGKMRSKVSRLKYVGAQPKVDASPKVTAQKTQKGMYSEEMQYIEEKLTAADPASKWISDFVASDNPKFAGKSKKERINMALGAYYAATGKGKQAEELNFQEAKKMDDMEDDYEDKMKDDEEEDDMEDDDDDEEEKKKKVDEKYMGFKAVMAAAKKGGARDPAAVAAAIGRKKYGKEKFQAAAAAGKKLGEGMDAVGREDKDIDNDGDTDKTDVYLHNKRKAIGNVIRKKLTAKLEKKDGE